MLLTIVLILAAMIAVSALELWLFWHLGERGEPRGLRMRADIDAANTEEWRADTRLREERHHTTGATARLRGRSTGRARARTRPDIGDARRIGEQAGPCLHEAAMRE